MVWHNNGLILTYETDKKQTDQTEDTTETNNQTKKKPQKTPEKERWDAF